MGPIWDAELRVWDAKNFGLVSPGTHRNKFVKKSLECPKLLSNAQADLSLAKLNFFLFLTLIFKITFYIFNFSNEKCRGILVWVKVQNFQNPELSKLQY